MSGKYTPGEGHVDAYANTLDECAAISLGPLEAKCDAAIAALRAAHAAVWDGADNLVKHQSSHFYRNLAARSDADAIKLITEYNQNTLDEIARSADPSIADRAVAAVKDFKRAVELQDAKQGAPAALTNTFDLCAHTDRVEKTRAIEATGVVKSYAFYLVLVEEGDVDALVRFESAAETFLQGIASGGTQKLLAANPEKFKLNPGDASLEVDAARKFLDAIAKQRDKRIPEWLDAARGVSVKLTDLCARLVGEHVNFMTPAQSSSLWTGSATLPNPLSVSRDWATRHLTTDARLPGWSPIEAKLLGGKVRRAPAASPTDVSTPWRT